MSTQHHRLARLRTRWSAIGAAVAVTLGAGGIGMANAAIDSGDRPVTVTIASERVLDTRTDLGLSGRFADATPRDLQITGSVPVASGGSKVVVPDDAIGVLVNVTVVTPSNDGFLSLRPSGATGEPTTSTVNFTPGSIEPNAATVDLNDGKIQIWVETSSDAGSADVLIDIVGYTIGHTHDDRYYTETEVDSALADKADAADTYTKSETDTAIANSGGVAWARTGVAATLNPTTATEVLQLPILVPVDGYVAVDAMANIVSPTGISVGCWVGLDTTAKSGAHSVQHQGASTTVTEWNDAIGFALSAGDHVLSLVCQQDNGIADDATIQVRTMTAVFSPTSIID